MNDAERAAVLAVLEKWRAAILADVGEPDWPEELWMQLAEALVAAGAEERK
jgi:hypothetical protein